GGGPIAVRRLPPVYSVGRRQTSCTPPVVEVAEREVASRGRTSSGATGGVLLPQAASSSPAARMGASLTRAPRGRHARAGGAPRPAPCRPPRGGGRPSGPGAGRPPAPGPGRGRGRAPGAPP